MIVRAINVSSPTRFSEMRISPGMDMFTLKTMIIKKVFRRDVQVSDLRFILDINKSGKKLDSDDDDIIPVFDESDFEDQPNFFDQKYENEDAYEFFQKRHGILSS